MTRQTAILPEAEAARLITLREAGPSQLPALRGRVKALRNANWSLAAIGAPLGANRSTTRMWELGAKPEDVTTASNVPVPTGPVKTRAVKLVRLYPDVPDGERPELARLADSARRVRGWTPADSQARKDALELERLLEVYVNRGVPLKRIAEHLGVTHRAIAARLERSRAKKTEVVAA